MSSQCGSQWDINTTDNLGENREKQQVFIPSVWERNGPPTRLVYEVDAGCRAFG
jgi:hypothetical protein